jgi:hypothetical protein
LNGLQRLPCAGEDFDTIGGVPHLQPQLLLYFFPGDRS